MIRERYIQLLKVRVSVFFILMLYPALMHARSEYKDQLPAEGDTVKTTLYISDDVIISGTEYLTNAEIILHSPATKSLKKKSRDISKKTVLKKTTGPEMAKRTGIGVCRLKIVNGNTGSSAFQKSLAERSKYNRENQPVFFNSLGAQVGNGTASLISKEPIFTYQIRYSAKKSQNRIDIRAPGGFFRFI